MARQNYSAPTTSAIDSMGVLDLLPHCVSGVYFLYHSDFEQWHFGKLSALREAALAIEGSYEYYYMGYYIHSCTKMRYKGDYAPQYVLDPETYEWNPLEGELRALLDKQSYVSLSRERRLKADSVADAPVVEYPLPTATEGGDAVSNGMSLFDLKVPGLMTIEDIEKQLDLGTIPIVIGGRMAEAQVCAYGQARSRLHITDNLQDLVSWDSSTLRDSRSAKGIIGELVACMGPEAAWQIAVELG
jgi:hypothetical protein